MFKYEDYQKSANFIKEKMGNLNPKIAIILGSGLGVLSDEFEEKTVIKYADIPNFPVSTVEGHAGELIIAKISGKEIIAMNGRFHYYEGYDLKESTFPVRVFKLLGIEKIVITKKKREYLDNYQYHETKNIKSKNPRYQVIVEHKRLGDIIGGTFEETSYQRQIFAQGSSRPQIVEQTTTTTATGSALPKLKANKSEARLVTKTKIETTSGPEATETTTTKKRTTTTTTTKTESSRPAQTATAKAEKITETTMKRRNEGTGSTTTSRTEKTTTTGGATGTSTTTKTTTRTVSEKPATETKTQSSTTTTTKTTTTRTTGSEGGKTETKTETKIEESSSGDAGASSIRKKYAKGRFKH